MLLSVFDAFSLSLRIGCEGSECLESIKIQQRWKQGKHNQYIINIIKKDYFVSSKRILFHFYFHPRLINCKILLIICGSNDLDRSRTFPTRYLFFSLHRKVFFRQSRSLKAGWNCQTGHWRKDKFTRLPIASADILLSFVLFIIIVVRHMIAKHLFVLNCRPFSMVML